MPDQTKVQDNLEKPEIIIPRIDIEAEGTFDLYIEMFDAYLLMQSEDDIEAQRAQLQLFKMARQYLLDFAEMSDGSPVSKHIKRMSFQQGMEIVEQLLGAVPKASEGAPSAG